MSTDGRIQRIARAIHRRQLDLVVALDRVHDRHNVSAVLRTSDAIGISQVLWNPDEVDEWQANPEVSRGAERWVSLKTTREMLLEVAAFQQNGFGVAATHLGAASVDYREVDWTKPWVVVMGNERRGCSEEILSIANANIILPMVGLIQSLNVSVATAVVLYEIQRQREKAGMYKQKLDRVQVEKIYRAWDLAREGIALQELLEPPPEDAVFKVESEHTDGRTQFAEKLRLKRQR